MKTVDSRLKTCAAEDLLRYALQTVLETGASIGYNVLVGNLASHLHGISLPKGFTSADVTPAVLSHLPAAVHQGFVAGYAESIQTVFLVAVPIAALAFLATWFIPQVELKRWPETPAAAAPEAEMAMASVTVAPEGQPEQEASFTDAGQAVSPPSGADHPARRV